MTFPVLVEPFAGQFAATLAGVPGVRVTAATREEAIAKVKAVIAERIGRGELVGVEVESPSPVDIAGKYASDPTLQGICVEAYRERDAEVAEVSGDRDADRKP
jgi:hypothetical protein